MTAHAQHRYPPRDPADKRPQLERDMVILLATQQRELDDLYTDHAIRCTLLRLPPISAALKTAVRADPPQPRRQLNAAWLNKKGHLAQYIGLPGPFARTCKVLRALFPLHIGEDCQSSWQGDLLTPLDCALLTKMWLHTGKTMGMLATDAGVPEAVLQGVIRTWLPLWGAAAKVLLHALHRQGMQTESYADTRLQVPVRGPECSGTPHHMPTCHESCCGRVAGDGGRGGGGRGGRSGGGAGETKLKCRDKAAGTSDRAAGTSDRAAGTSDSAAGTIDRAAGTSDRAAGTSERDPDIKSTRDTQSKGNGGSKGNGNGGSKGGTKSKWNGGWSKGNWNGGSTRGAKSKSKGDGNGNGSKGKGVKTS